MLLHPLKAFTSTVDKPSGREMFSRLLQYKNAEFSMVLSVDGRDTVVRDVQFWKQDAPTVSIPSGITMLVSEVQPLNARADKVKRLVGRETLVRFVHSLNAETPTVVVPSSMVTVVMLLLYSLQGMGLPELKFAISPEPEITNSPLLYSVHVRFVPSPSAPQ